MGWIFAIASGVAAYLIYSLQNEATTLFWVALVVAIPNFWSFGIIWNHRFDKDSPQAWTVIHTLSTVGGIGLLVYGIAMKLS